MVDVKLACGCVAAALADTPPNPATGAIEATLGKEIPVDVAVEAAGRENPVLAPVAVLPSVGKAKPELAEVVVEAVLTPTERDKLDDVPPTAAVGLSVDAAPPPNLNPVAAGAAEVAVDVAAKGVPAVRLPPPSLPPNPPSPLAAVFEGAEPPSVNPVDEAATVDVGAGVPPREKAVLPAPPNVNPVDAAAGWAAPPAAGVPNENPAEPPVKELPPRLKLEVVFCAVVPKAAAGAAVVVPTGVIERPPVFGAAKPPVCPKLKLEAGAAVPRVVIAAGVLWAAPPKLKPAAAGLLAAGAPKLKDPAPVVAPPREDAPPNPPNAGAGVVAGVEAGAVVPPPKLKLDAAGAGAAAPPPNENPDVAAAAADACVEGVPKLNPPPPKKKGNIYNLTNKSM